MKSLRAALILIFIISFSAPSYAEGEDDIITKSLKIPARLVEGALAFDLGKVVITPTKYGITLGESTVSATVADEEDFAKGVFYDASGPLDRINSIRVERYGTQGQSSSPVIRGMIGTRVLVLVDGVPANSPSLGEADLSKIPMGKVERIEVVRGPYSSLYGADAVGGVINIITKAVPEKPMARAAYSFGSWNTHDVTIENGATYGKLGYNVITNYQCTDGERGNSDNNAFDLDTKAKLKLFDEVDYMFQTSYYGAKTEHPGARPPISIAQRTLTQRILGNEDVSSLFDYSTTARTRLNSVLNVKNLTLQHYFIYWDDDDHRESLNINGNRLIDQDEFRTLVYGMEAKFVQPILDIDTVTVGTTLSRKIFKVKTHQFNEVTRQHAFGDWKALRKMWSVYGENEFKLYPFTVVFGLRRDNSSDFGSRWSPKISGMVDLGFDTKVRASYGRAYRAPTLDDLNWPQDAWSEGNPNLKVEKSEGYEVGIEKLFGNVLLARATFFRANLQDAISWAPVGTRVVTLWGAYARWTPTNLNSVSNKGLELEARFNIFDEIDVSLDYTYLDSEETITATRDWNNTNLSSESRRKSAYIPAHKIGTGFDWKGPFKIKGLQISSFLRFVSERRNWYSQFGTWPNTAQWLTEKKLDHYFIWDAKLSYKYKDNIGIFFAANNILDEGYEKFGSTLFDRGYPQEGMSLTAGVEISY